MQHAIYVCENTVIDPITNAPVEVAIYRDMESGGLFGIDSSYLLTLDFADPVSNPFNGKDIKLVDSPSSCHFYLADIHYPDDRTDMGGLVFCALDGLPDDSPYTDDDVFYYGMGIEEARLSIDKKYLNNDFIITRVQSLNMDVISAKQVGGES
jgi:hypothetical protein